MIAETTDLPTRFARIVVTDEHGRYVILHLPQANYSVWVRGDGLVDAPKVQAAPGKRPDPIAVPAANEAAAAQYYPAIYWYAMLTLPHPSQFGGKSNFPEQVTQTDQSLRRVDRPPRQRRAAAQQASATPGRRA